MSVSFSRIALVTAGLAGVGVVCGAVLGGLAFSVQMHAISADLNSHMATWPTAKRLQLVVAEQWFFFRFGAAVGGYVGSVLAPTVGWIFLRRAPLHRAIQETALGTLIGIVVAAVIQPRFVLFYALGGFLTGATRLWLAEHGRQARAS